MLAWIVATIVGLHILGAGVAYYLSRDRSRDPPRLDDETREILDGWTED